VGRFLEDEFRSDNSNLGDNDQQFGDHMGVEKPVEWDQLRRIIVEYVATVIIWIVCIYCNEPRCGIPMRSWVVNYLFFRLFKCVHNAIGIMLILNETPIYYKPWAKMVVFTLFEQFEWWWMIFGEYLFFFAPQNYCRTVTGGPDQELSSIEL